jgi:HEPN domain-containing protein
MCFWRKSPQKEGYCLKAETGEWVAKAEGNFADAQRGVRVRKNPNYDGVCFHCQQCIEKYLKSRLIEAGVKFPKIHDLSRLLDLLLPSEPPWELWRPDLEVLTDYAVMFRYPGETATHSQARQAFAISRRLRTALRESLGLHNGKGAR